MSDPAAFVPGAMGVGFLVVGIATWRSEMRATNDGVLGLTALGPVFVAAAVAAFAGEHFTAGPQLAKLVPKWMPARLFVAYFVGAAHLAFAVSVVARRYIKWSSLALCVMFAMFVLLMDLPGAFARPEVRMAWSLAARQATFSIGALALFATITRGSARHRADVIANVAQYWTAAVLVFYGAENVLFPQFSPGVPDAVPTPAFLPMPNVIAYATGFLLVACGLAMFVRRFARAGATVAGAVMTLLTVAIYVPQWAIATNTGEQVVGINFTFDTLLFAGTMLVIGRALSD